MAKKNKAEVATVTPVKKDNIMDCRQDFMMLISVRHATLNGDPATNRPRVDLDGYGLVTDVCIKHKIRTQLAGAGEPVLIQGDADTNDGFRTVKSRLKACEAAENAKTDEAKKLAVAESFIDARAFGFLVPAKKQDGPTLSMRGPVSIDIGITVSPVNIIPMEITKSTNMEQEEGYESSRMGVKPLVEFGLYVVTGTISPWVAEKTGFTYDDLEKVKEAMTRIFDDKDISAARPGSSIAIEHLYWWDHRKNVDGKTPKLPAAMVMRSVEIEKKGDAEEFPRSMKDYEITVKKLKGIELPEDLAIKDEYEE